MFDRLEPRERLMIILTIAVMLLSLFGFFVYTMSRKMHRLERKISDLNSDVELIQGYARRISEIDARIGEVQLPGGTRCDRNLYGSIESLARRESINDISIRPLQSPENPYFDEQSVEIEVRKVPLVNLVNLLFAIDRSPQSYRAWKFNARRRFDDANLLDSRFQVSAFCGKENVTEPAAKEGGKP